MVTHRYPTFLLLALTVLEGYKIEGQPRRPMLKVSPAGEIYFHGNTSQMTERISLDMVDNKLFHKKTDNQKIFDFHYDIL